MTIEIESITTTDHLIGRPHCFKVGKGGVTKIIQHAAQGEGDKWYYDVIHSDRSNVRLFDFHSVEFKEK